MYWEYVLPDASLRPAQLLTLIWAASSAPTRHAAWFASGLAMSLTGAYRWFTRWHQSTHAMRTRLDQVSDPPGKVDGLADPYSLRHLGAAFPACPCPAAAFQNRFQIPVCP